jgi:hypothetical protein
MRYPVGEEVPFTAGVSGIVFCVALFSLGTWQNEVILFVVWGLIYAVECVIRKPWRHYQERPVTPSPQQPAQTR